MSIVTIFMRMGCSSTQSQVNSKHVSYCTLCCCVLKSAVTSYPSGDVLDDNPSIRDDEEDRLCPNVPSAEEAFESPNTLSRR